MSLNYFIEGFRSRFPKRDLVLRNTDSTVVIPAAHADAGDIEVVDDLDEWTVFVGDFTHSHFTWHGELPSEEARQRQIADDVLDFLGDVFSDRIEFFRKSKGNGGWRRRGSSDAFNMSQDLSYQ